MQHSQEQTPENILTSTRFRSVTYIDETGSTNSDLLAQLASGQASVGDVLIAGHQHSGKGRNQRAWLDHKGTALLASIACELPTELASLAPLAAGLSVVDAVDEIATTPGIVGLKWPNDILATNASSGKLAGVLVESLHSSNQNKNMQLVIGVGLNLTWSQPPIELAEIATTLEQFAGEPIDRNAMLGRLLSSLDNRLNELEKDVNAMLDTYRSCCLTLGKPVSASTSHSLVSGIATDVNDQGELLIEIESGTIITVSAGDVNHLR